MSKQAICCAVLIASTSFAFTDTAYPQGVAEVDIAFTGAQVIADPAKPPIRNATLVVSRGKIRAMGPSGDIDIPTGARRISLAGKTIIPGLVNAHGHLLTRRASAGQNVEESATRELRTYAAYGITTVFGLGDEPRAAFAVRDAQDVVTLDRARLFLAGSILMPDTVEEARRLVNEDVALHVNLAKTRVDDNLHGSGGASKRLPPEVYTALIEEAHKHGLRAAVHLYYLDDAKAVVRAGADFITHSIRDADVDQELIDLMKARHVCLSPTLTRELANFVYESSPDFFLDPLFLKHADAAIVRRLADPQQQQLVANDPWNAKYKQSLAQAKRNLKRLVDAGVRVALGSDSGSQNTRFQGYFEWLELDLMRDAGMTPQQILIAATKDAAACVGLEDQIGVLAIGRWADFVVLNDDPLRDVRHLRDVHSVWIAGNTVQR